MWRRVRLPHPQTWLRRVSLELIGLPPSPSELDGFLKDKTARGEAAYAAVVDRLLSSPHYGERMAIDWLDVARYADTHGFNNDAARSMWRWRDWVIQSFNANMPYDRFLTEQLAGDLMPSPTLDQRIATGFGRNHVINSEGGIIDEEYRIEYVADRVRTVSLAWMGLTFECARCHDHKYDPIKQRDYYRLYSFFNNVPEIGEDGRVANAAPIMPAPTNEQRQRLQELESVIGRLNGELANRERAWIWRESDGARALEGATKAKVPGDAALHITCDSPNEFSGSADLAVVPGVAGTACAAESLHGKPETAAIAISKRLPLTFSFWLNPSALDRDVPLLSAINYATNPAATTYGSGIELRLSDGELEFRYGQRFPAYSMRVRSQGAHLVPGAWRHVALVYAAVTTPDPKRAPASWVRIYVDGNEAPTLVLNDGMQLPEAKSDKASPTRFRIGWGNAPAGARYSGRLDEIEIWPRALNGAEIEGRFEALAIPYAVARQRAQQATALEIGWLRTRILCDVDSGFAQKRQELNRKRGEMLALQREAPSVMVMSEMSPGRQTHILLRGAYNMPGEKVEPGVPEELLGAWPQDAPKNRLGLAKWLTNPNHPLTARVVVNRFWQQIFGNGIVRTSENLGLQGESPTHPELLDWLARDFIESGWDVKGLMKQIVLSSTYRQSSAASPQSIKRDPENRLLARGPRVRLAAEVLRDQALAISGLLKPRLGGPSVYPYQPADLYKGMVVAGDYPGTVYTESRGDDLYRRSLYTFWKRTVPHPTMTVFDAPDREFCVVRRITTNTPLQALTLLNDPIFVEAARKLAERTVRDAGNAPDAGVDYMFRLATSRTPDAAERQILRRNLDKLLRAYQADEKGAKDLLSVGASAVPSDISRAELAAYTAMANIVLNMDEVLTKN